MSPNPMVGAVFVVNDRIVSKGWHEVFGGSHAEVIALKDISREMGEKGSLYVNLEPCCFTGKTPPCTRMILEKGVPHVIVGMLDPNPRVNGKGVEFLRQNGVKVDFNVMENKCRELNRPYIKYITQGIPEVILKAATTLDGRIATCATDSRWISGQKARTYTHRMRAEFDAVMVGVGTVLADNPLLTVRHIKGRNPLRVIVDTNLKTPLSAKILINDPETKTIIFAGDHLPPEKLEEYNRGDNKIIPIGRAGDGHLDLEQIMLNLGTMGIASVIVEGGSYLFTSLLKSKIADRLVAVIAPKVIGGDGVPFIRELGIKSMESVESWRLNRVKRLDNDIMLEIFLKEY